MDKYVRQVQEGDIEYVASNMREADVEECTAQGWDAHSGLLLSVHCSQVAYTLVDKDGKPAAILGVAKGIYSDSGAIWLLGTDAIEKNPTAFLRWSKPVLTRLFEETGYGFLYNYTHCNNEVHHRWLKWLGFSFLRKVQYGPDGDPFYEFAKLREEFQCAQ